MIQSLKIEDFRVIELDSGFRVQRLFVVKSKGLFWRKKIKTWFYIDAKACALPPLMFNSPLTVSFSSLEKAQEWIKAFVNPKPSIVIIHPPQ